MTDHTIPLDLHRGMAAQKATDVRRQLVEVEANARTLREQQEELEAQLAASPSDSWLEAAAKARYLLDLLAGTSVAQDPRRTKLIANVLDDFARLSRAAAERQRACQPATAEAAEGTRHAGLASLARPEYCGSQE